MLLPLAILVGSALRCGALNARFGGTGLCTQAQCTTRQPLMHLATAPPAPSTDLDSLLDSMEDAAIELDGATAPTERPMRGADGRLAPVLTLPGDTLETSREMVGITIGSTLLVLAIVARAFVLGGGTPLWPASAVVLGMLAGEMFSGAFHWATDNYGRLETPVVGFACAAFQGHHLAPWTISHRSTWNNVFKIAGAAIPLSCTALALLPPSASAFLAIMLYCQVLAQEFHRWSHTPPSLLPRWKRSLQKHAIALPVREHLAHHKPPFDKHYCILTGRLNAWLDSSPVYLWRRLEAIVYRLNGVEPLSWKDERVKELALSL